MDGTDAKPDALENVIGAGAYDGSGDKIGTVTEVYLDDETGRPEWATIRTDHFGTTESFVPLRNADLTDNGVRVPVSKDQVTGAPKIDTDGHLSPAEEEELYRYYSIGQVKAADMTSTQSTTNVSGPVDANDDAVGQETSRRAPSGEEGGRARLRRYIVSEKITDSRRVNEGPGEATQTPAAKKPSTPLGKVKVSFNLWPEDVERLRQLAGDARTTVTAALQRAIADETFLVEELGKGAALLLKYPDGEYRQVIIRR